MQRSRVGFLAGVLILGAVLCGTAAADEKKNACKALVQYMKQGRAIIQQVSGDERAKRLADLKAKHAAGMQAAPAKAKSAAEAFLKYAAGYLDGTNPDDGYLILVNRDAALKACGTTPSQAGF
jgi:hypothetical protein